MTPPRRQRRYPTEQPPPPPLPLPAPPQQGNGKPERLFVVAGKDGGERAELDLVTLIVASAAPPPSAAPEQAALLRLCTTPLSVAELSAYLNLPFSAMTVLLTDMLTAELVTARAPIVRQSVADRSLLEAVMHGLQRL
ncbi:DUF742 domain-containing protein [Streptomyces sp. ISL-22]|uniref:DUF742 domain-containing protein n=1 Tax=Streptomyces curacoi TaxID=146536 RepID=A0A117P199_9ACTN|nr:MULTISPECIES: DUF742 domain-containing protein [Streptomyces]KUM71243.1 hypothetical protein AQI70_27165 [Streptomyces curacoi]MBT2422104.1 DUF742 domain-containing protein [Streptomyces sp. ISL-24]MBT2437361.1 DUF742 domain-containing protein [Streptomyces sp. ISL-22]